MTPSALLKRVLAYGALLSAVIAVLGSVVGYLAAGSNGLVSALIGAAMALVFTSLTALSILLAVKVTGMNLLNPLFFGIVLGVMLLKFLLFVILANLLNGQEFIQPMVLFVTLIIAVIGTLITDAIAFMKSRIAYLPGVALPGDEENNPGDRG